jgi:hypothetical protein
MRALAGLTGWSLALAVVALSNCTAVLGIHKAELDDGGTPGGGSTGTSSSATGGNYTPPPVCTTPAESCSACLQTNCPGPANACLADHDCRKSLEAYATCLGQDCTDQAGDCAEMIKAPDMGIDLGLCIVGDQCKSKCSPGRPVSRCELFCSCMQHLCNNDFKSGLGNDIATCVSMCEPSWTDRDVNCRWNHCEFAMVDPVHCSHAMFAPDKCNEVPVDKRSKPCFDGFETGYPCQFDKQCCSKSCVGGTACAGIQ